MVSRTWRESSGDRPIGAPFRLADCKHGFSGPVLQASVPERRERERETFLRIQFSMDMLVDPGRRARVRRAGSANRRDLCSRNASCVERAGREEVVWFGQQQPGCCSLTPRVATFAFFLWNRSWCVRRRVESWCIVTGTELVCKHKLNLNVAWA